MQTNSIFTRLGNIRVLTAIPGRVMHRHISACYLIIPALIFVDYVGVVWPTTTDREMMVLVVQSLSSQIFGSSYLLHICPPNLTILILARKCQQIKRVSKKNKTWFLVSNSSLGSLPVQKLCFLTPKVVLHRRLSTIEDRLSSEVVFN